MAKSKVTDPFATLKKSQGSIDKLVKALADEQSSFTDEREWRAQQDKAGNAYAIIRFLPEPAGEDMPWVKLFHHGFQQSGGWFIENCPTTIHQGDVCPVCEWNSELWNASTDDNSPQRRIVRGTPNNPGTKRKLSYYSNILVIKDSANPDNEGKVFLFRYGKKIFDKIKAIMDPTFEEEEAVNPFNFWKGANFKLKIRKVDGYANYDESKFEDPSALFDGDDEKLRDLYTKLHSLQEIIAPEKFKSKDDLKQRLDRVRKSGGGARAEELEEVDAPVARHQVTAPTSPIIKESEPEDVESADESGVINAEDGDKQEAYDYFEKLAGNDE